MMRSAALLISFAMAAVIVLFAIELLPLIEKFVDKAVTR